MLGKSQKEEFLSKASPGACGRASPPGPPLHLDDLAAALGPAGDTVQHVVELFERVVVDHQRAALRAAFLDANAEAEQPAEVALQRRRVRVLRRLGLARAEIGRAHV